MTGKAKRTPEERAKDRADMAAYLRRMAREQIETAAEFVDMAERYDDRDRNDADRGHTFRISVELRGSSAVVGDEHHEDAPNFDALEAVEVRAWNLREAFAVAAALPLSAYFDDNEWSVDSAIGRKADG